MLLRYSHIRQSGHPFATTKVQNGVFWGVKSNTVLFCAWKDSSTTTGQTNITERIFRVTAGN